MSRIPSTKPPRFGTWILRIIYNASLFNEVFGDLQELYNERLQSKGRLTAVVHYYKDVLLSLRNIGLKDERTINNNSYVMLPHYFKITIRNIERSKVYSSLNILGLALGMAAFLFILEYTTYERGYDQFHPNFENIYRVTFEDYRNGQLQRNSASTVPRIGPFIKENMPEAVKFTRAHPFPSLVIAYNNKMFRQNRVLMVDPEFLSIFNFPLIEGNPETALNNVRTVILTESTAKKYFGNESALGKTISVDGIANYEVTGVAKDIPDNSHIKFDWLFSYETIKWWSEGEAEDSWNWNLFYTYILLESGTDIPAFEQRFDKIMYEHRSEIFKEYNFRYIFPLQALGDIHLFSNLEWEIVPDEQGDVNAINFLTLVAFFILAVAWINYINLSTARSIERSKEVGIRKTLGAFRLQMIKQFIFESLILNIISLWLGIIFFIVEIKYFNWLTNSKLGLNFLKDPMFWGLFTAVFTFGAILSALYPALVLSSYKPIDILKGTQVTGLSSSIQRKVLVVLQFTASIILIAGTTIIFMQLKHMNDQDLGFDQDELIVFRGPNYREDEFDSKFLEHHSAFLNELRQNSNISSIAGGSNIPGREIVDPAGIKRYLDSKGDYKVFSTLWIGHNYLPTLKIDVIAGRVSIQH